MESILTTIKQMLGIAEADTNFDRELVVHINGAIMIANQLGVGPSAGFRITGATETWTDLIGTRTDIDLVKNDIYLRVRLIFDPPQNAFLVTAFRDEIKEYEWRIECYHDPDHEVFTEPVDPTSLDSFDDPDEF